MRLIRDVIGTILAMIGIGATAGWAETSDNFTTLLLSIAMIFAGAALLYDKEYSMK